MAVCWVGWRGGGFRLPGVICAVLGFAREVPEVKGMI